LLDFYGYAAFVVIALLFFILISVSASKTQVESRAGFSDTSLVLLNILKTPVKANTNIADILVRSAVSKDFDEFQKSAIPLVKKHFESNFQECCWELKILKAGEELKKFTPTQCDITKEHEMQTIIQLPPLSQKDSAVEVIFSIYLTKSFSGEAGGWRMDNSEQCTYLN